ncbi:S8 family serine peptidase [Tautonia sociabilis]|uniref:Peptidase S8 n=1 Tax=Tautonia sociabilis TaxID=2080755 RepID=A0A432MC46_9BACT|nr:S8 family serine peptidase [Tautonia sociabilis]RUL81585.1 hypothetical protein TsocGM_24960 [Tautonia sociabilis]
MGGRTRGARASARALTVEAMEERLPLSGLGAGVPVLEVDPDSYHPGRIVVGSMGGSGDAASGGRVVELPPGVSVPEALARMRTAPGMSYAEPDYAIRVRKVPNDPSFGSQYGLRNTGQSGGTSGADIGAATAWDVTTGSGEVVVAVIDTGVDYTHPDLAANIWTNAGEIPGNNTDDDGNGFVDDVRGWDFYDGDNDPMDDDGHGTHVAGIIGAVGNNGVGVSGVNWQVRLMPVRFLGPQGGFTSDAVRALNYAVANGATISNNSWGGGGYSTSLRNAISNAQQAGHLFVAAAGNDGRNTDSSPHYPSSYDLDNIISVAASNRNDALAGFSNFGETTVDLAAPGVSILSTTPNGSYSSYSGTSMASPMVAGAAALIKARFPDWTWSQIKAQLLATVDPDSGLSGRVATGGRLDVGRALTEGAAAVTRPQVSQLLPGVPVSGPVRVLRVDFAEAIDPESFTAADVSVTAPLTPGFAEGTPVTVKNVVPISGTGGRGYAVVIDAQSAEGTYAVSIGPEIADSGGLAMATSYSGSFTIQDVRPPTLVSGAPEGATSGPVATLRLTFSERIDGSTVSTADVSVTGPSGAVAVLAVSPVGGSDGARFDVTIASQSAEGDYAVAVGPAISDANGNPMASVSRFGFTIGTPRSPTVSAMIPGGLVVGTVRVVRITFSEVIDPDSFSTDDISYTGPNGPVGPIRIRPVSGSGGRQFDLVTEAQETPGAYSVTVGPEIRDLSGSAMVSAFTGGFEVADRSPPTVVSAVPGWTISGPMRVARVTFDRAIAPNSFVPGVVTFTAPGGVVAVQRIRPVQDSGDTRFDIIVPTQSASGSYSVRLGTGIRSRFGTAMEQPFEFGFAIR